MKKTWLIIVIVLVALIAWAMSSRNSMVQSRNEVELQLSNLDAQYQRRSDLIPNLVEVAKGAAGIERETLNDVIEARSRATSIQLTPEMASDPQAMQQFQQAQNNLGSALSRLMVVVERYPDLKSQANFQNLMVQLEGTENRITQARRDYNTSVRDYNTRVESFPGNVVAGIFGFDRFRSFEAAEGSQNAPRVDFGTGGGNTTAPAEGTQSGTPERPSGPARPAPARPAPAH